MLDHTDPRSRNLIDSEIDKALKNGLRPEILELSSCRVLALRRSDGHEIGDSDSDSLPKII